MGRPEFQMLLYLLCDPGQVTCSLWDIAERDLPSPLGEMLDMSVPIPGYFSDLTVSF